MKSNPLATRYVSPGRIAWQASEPAAELSALADRFKSQLHWRGAIVGPHGSGKSTLLEHLVPRLGSIVARQGAVQELDDANVHRASLPGGKGPGGNGPEVNGPEVNGPEGNGIRSITWLRMRGKLAASRLLLRTLPNWCHRQHLVVIDGYEQLPVALRGLTLAATRMAGCGILVTSHRRVYLPTLVETKVDAALALQLLEQLLPPEDAQAAPFMNTQTIARLLEKHHGNLRELFMELYDQFE